MRRTVLFGPPPATLEVLLDDPQEQDFPATARILRGLAPEQALALPPGLRDDCGTYAGQQAIQPRADPSPGPRAP